MKFWHILEKQENDVRKAAKDVQEDLCPFDLSDEDAVQMEERSQRIERVLELVQKKVRRLKQQVKDRKFRHNPESLIENVVSCSQYSLLQSQEAESQGESDFGAVDETGDAYLIQRPSKYRTKSLDQDVLQNTEKEGL